MNNIQKRFLYFLLLCIPLRVLLVFLASYLKGDNLKYLGIVALVIGLGFLIIYSLDLRKTGPEVMNSKIWWNHLRPVHGILYIVFAYMALTNNQNAWKILLLDVIIGFVSFIAYHYGEGHINQIYNR